MYSLATLRIISRSRVALAGVSVGLTLVLAACSGSAGGTPQASVSTPPPSNTSQAAPTSVASPTAIATATVARATAIPVTVSPTLQKVAPAAQVAPTAQASLDPKEVAAGKTAFLANCASCHGQDAAGGVKLGNVTSPDLRWSHLGPIYHEDTSLVRQAILTGKDEDGKDLDPVMPHWQGKLSDADVSAIITYLESMK